MFIDTHTHLFAEEFDEDRSEVVNRSIAAGVQKMLLPNIDESTVERMYQLCNDFPSNCYPMMGIHPCSVKKEVHQQLENFKKLMENKSFIAIGEIGIDLHWDKESLSEQEIAFRTQVQWAKEMELPVVIHARKSYNELFAILDEETNEKLTGVFHCFSGSKEQLKKIKSYGFKIGIGGVVSFKNAGLAEVLQFASIDDIVLETDSPYLSPVPFRGKRNESSYLLHVAEKLSEIFAVSLSEIEERTTQNAQKLFSKIIN